MSSTTPATTTSLWVRSDEPRARPRQLRWVLPRPGAAAVLVASGALVTAFSAILMEETFPLAHGRRWAVGFTGNGWRLIGFIVSGLATAWAVWSLRVHRRRRGTLYYVRMQNEVATDLHRDAAERATEEYLAYRSIAAWFDPGPGTVDVRPVLATVTAELQRTVNDDSHDSGYDIAPNLIFPAALAAGYDWVPPPQVNLREINGPGRPDFEWRLGCATSSGGRCRRADDPKHRIEHFNPDRSAGPHRISAWPRTTQPDPAVRSVWLELRLTGEARTMEPPYETDLVRVVGVTTAKANEGAADLTAEPLTYAPRSALPATRLTTLQVAEGAAYWIGRTLNDYPAATVFVAAALPKTVSFAVGHLLTQPTPTGAAAHLWRRIVPMGHFQHENELRPMWVRPDQRDPDELIAALFGPRPGGRSRRRFLDCLGVRGW